MAEKQTPKLPRHAFPDGKTDDILTLDPRSQTRRLASHTVNDPPPRPHQPYPPKPPAASKPLNSYTRPGPVKNLTPVSKRFHATGILLHAQCPIPVQPNPNLFILANFSQPLKGVIAVENAQPLQVREFEVLSKTIVCLSTQNLAKAAPVPTLPHLQNTPPLAFSG